MTCRNCGAELPVGAKFCHECGTAVGDEAPTEVVTPQEAEADVQAEARAEADAHEPQVPLDGQPSAAPEDVDVQLVDAADPVEAPPAALPPDDTETGVTSPALQQQVPTPPREPKPARERRPLEEQGAWEEFTAAVVPLLRAPRFTGNLLAAFVAFAVSFAAALAIWALLDNAFDRHAGLVLPGFVDTDRDGAGVLALLTLVLHQVPMINDEDVSWGAPLLLAIVPLLGCAVGMVVGRRVMPCSGRGRGFPSRVAPFALLYGVILFFWSLFGAQDWHAAHVGSFLAGVVFAILGAWIAERWLARRGEPAAKTAGARTDQPADPVVRRELAAVRTAARVLALMLLIGAVGWLAGTIIEATQVDRDRGAAVAAAVLQVGEGGFKALGFGVLAEGDPFGVAERVRIYDAAELMHDAAFVIMLVTALAVVVVGGLFSGFAIARRVAPRSRNDHALFGAVTGPVWAVAMLVAQFVVLSRYRQGDDTFTSFDGTETFFLSLLVGTVLGALGGLLAAHSRRSA